MGNVCRTPLALAVLTTLAARYGIDGLVGFDSAGTRARRGSPPDPRAIRVAEDRGYDIARMRARPVRAQDFDAFDLILAMDRPTLSLLLENCPAHASSKVSLFLAHAGIVFPEEVPDPYYGGMAGFEHVLDLCEEAGHRLIQNLNKQTPQK